MLVHPAGTLVPYRPGRSPPGPVLGWWRERRPLVLAPSTAEPKGAILQERKHWAVKIAADCFSLSNPNRSRMRLVPARIFCVCV